MDYKESGVDIEKGEQFVKRIEGILGQHKDSRVLQGVGGFAALYKITEDKLLATGTDGVGTKVKIAQALGIHDTIGIDLVAMCVNDIICTGALPLFFLDYLACGKLDVEVGSKIIEGIQEGCRQSQMALVGGETAEMPGVYADGVYDLAGFAVGEVATSELIDGSQVKKGDAIIGVASSGFHSNGYSLVRNLIKGDDELKAALTPTKIYVELVRKLLLENRVPGIKGFAHITGGGFHNIARINQQFGYQIDFVPAWEQIPAIFRPVCQRSGASFEELYKTFNMGVGFAIVCSDVKTVSKTLSDLNLDFWQLGRVDDSFQGIRFEENLVKKWTLG